MEWFIRRNYLAGDIFDRDSIEISISERKVKFCDIRKYYMSLKRATEATDLKKVKEYRRKHNESEFEEIEEIENHFVICVFGLWTYQQDYDVLFAPHVHEVKKRGTDESIYIPNYCDCIFDIRVHNATYAQLELNGNVLDMEKIGTNLFGTENSEDMATFTLKDITYDNPLFLSGGFIYVKTDGEKLSFRTIFIMSNYSRNITCDLAYQSAYYLPSRDVWIHL